MQVLAYPFPGAITEKQYYNKTVVVVDVLRATTSIVEALQNGAIQVIPAREPGEATAYISHLGKKESLLAGEKGGLPLPGFDLGNSPQEFTPQAVKGKSLVFCTSNGTVAIHAARLCLKLLIGCLRNREAVGKAAANPETDIIVLCAGTACESSADDIVAAGGILKALIASLEEEPQLNDFARICMLVYDAYKRGEADLSETSHYKELMRLGFEADLQYCFEEDKTDIVPVYQNGSIRIMKTQSPNPISEME